jgi:hypothetical protein
MRGKFTTVIDRWSIKVSNEPAVAYVHSVSQNRPNKPGSNRSGRATSLIVPVLVCRSGSLAAVDRLRESREVTPRFRSSSWCSTDLVCGGVARPSEPLDGHGAMHSLLMGHDRWRSNVLQVEICSALCSDKSRLKWRTRAIRAKSHRHAVMSLSHELYRFLSLQLRLSACRDIKPFCTDSYRSAELLCDDLCVGSLGLSYCGDEG